jgi:hypothetical protein
VAGPSATAHGRSPGRGRLAPERLGGHQFDEFD